MNKFKRFVLILIVTSISILSTNLSHAQSYPAWQPNTAYSVGALVTYNGSVYKCLQAHTSQMGWEPPNTPSLWELQTTITTATQVPTTAPTNTLAAGGDGTPYGSTARSIPGTIEVEDYNTGGEGVAYHDTTAGNSGNVYRTDDVDAQACTDAGCGYNIGWVAVDEWTKYTVNVQATGTYTVDFRVASSNSTGRFHLEVDGINVTGSLAVPLTGAWQTYTTVSKTGVSLSAGQHVLRLYTEATGVNYNWIKFTGSATNTPVPPTATSTAAPTITPTTPTATNLALGKPVTFSAEQLGNEASHAVDGDLATRWSADVFPEWIQVDLGTVYSLNKTEIVPYLDRAYQYKIEVSGDGALYTQVVNRTGNTTGGSLFIDTFAAVQARYVKLTVTGAANYTGTWSSVLEFRVYGSPVTATNTAAPPTATKTNTPITPTSVPTNTPTPTNTPAIPTNTNTPPGASPTPPVTTANTYIRVNQVGYVANESKRAMLLTNGTGTMNFAVINKLTGVIVLNKAVPTTSSGSWSTTFTQTFLLDFSTVTAPGSYYIQVTGAKAAVSPTFKIDSATNLYQPLLANTLFYFQVQRDGANVINVMNRKASHLTDQTAKVYNQPTYSTGDPAVLQGSLSPVGTIIDASGGWFDAGDYLKFVQTASFVQASMLWGVREHQGVLDSGSSNFAVEGKFGMDWLRKMWDDSSKILYYQVGIGDGNSSYFGDHDDWRLPEADDARAISSTQTSNQYYYVKYRPVFRAGAANAQISPNLAGRLAASFALCYQVYRVSDPTYANQCLVSAQHIYDLAKTSNVGTLLSVSPHQYYPESEWRDDLELGAIELYYAVKAGAGSLPTGLSHTDPNYFLQQSAHWANLYTTAGQKDTLNLYDVSALGHYELHRAISTSGFTGTLEITQAQLVSDLKAQVDQGIADGNTDPFERGFQDNDATPHALGLATTAHFYDKLTNTTTYRKFELTMLDWALGKNAWGSSFIVGAGSTFPKCMQHQVANLSGSLNGTPPILSGATVDGPSGTGNFTGLDPASSPMRICPADGVDRFKAFNANGMRYFDDVSAWPSVEPANDYTIMSYLAFSVQLP